MRSEYTIIIYLITFGFLVILLLGACSSSQIPDETPDISVNLDQVTLQVAMPPGFEDISIFDDFVKANPGTNIVINNSANPFYPSTLETSLTQHLSGARNAARTADVIYVSSSYFSIESTRADFFQNLEPLISSDPSSVSDFLLPSFQDSFAWDGGIWALPFAGVSVVLAYQQDMFDQAGISTPSEQWTLAEIEYAARQFSENQSFDQQTPALLTLGYEDLILQSLIGASFYQVEDGLYHPQIDSPRVAEILEQWQRLRDDGLVGTSLDTNQSIEDFPMVIQTSRLFIQDVSSPDLVWSAAALPGNNIGMELHGFAISSGTGHPELAYKLAKYLTSKASILSYLHYDTLINPILLNDLNSDSIPYMQVTLDSIGQALERPLLPSDRLFSQYLSLALDEMEVSKGNTSNILDNIELQINNTLEAAATQGIDETFFVDTSRLPVTPQAGEITLNFGGLNHLQNDTVARDLIDEFVLSDSEIGSISMIDIKGLPQDYIDQVDCFFYPNSLVGVIPPEMLVNLQPLISVDEQFHSGDIAGNALSQLSLDSDIYGYPFVLYPLLLLYRESFFDKDNPFTNLETDITTFIETLEQTQIEFSQGKPVMVPLPNQGNTYLLMLMAAHGAVPYDYRTSPPTLNITDPDVIQVMEQVLDFAKAELVYYEGLDQQSQFQRPAPPETAMFVTIVDAFTFSVQYDLNASLAVEQNNFEITSFPHGSGFRPVSYDVGAGYISGSTIHQEACYRWLSFISDKTHLFNGIPANLATIDDETNVASQGEVIKEFYQNYASIITSNDAIHFPPHSNRLMDIRQSIEVIWLNRAFDAYVLEDADLAAQLDIVNENIHNFRLCVQNISIDEQDSNNYSGAVFDCGLAITPNLS